jgi:hypothetical protein
VSVSVSVNVKAATLLRDLVAPPAPGESVKAQIGRAARRAGLSFTRSRKIWYGEAQLILAEEWIALQEAVRRRCGDCDELRSESQDLAASIDRIEAELARLRSRLEGFAASPSR